MSYHDLSSNYPSIESMDRDNGPTTSTNTSFSRKRSAPVEFHLNRDQSAPKTACSSQMELQVFQNSMEGSWTQAYSNTFDGNSMPQFNYLNDFTNHQNAGLNMHQPYFAGWSVMHSSPINNNFLTNAGQETHFSEPYYSQHNFCNTGHSASHPTEQIDGLREIQSTPSESSGNSVESSEVPESKDESIYPTFGTGMNLREYTVIDVIDGRLPAVGTRSKYRLTVDELRRRCGAPENMNLSGLYSFFRKSKKKAYHDKLKLSLTQNNIIVKTMQRQKKINRFTPLLEEEALHLAQDLDNLTRMFMPVKEIGRQMLDNMRSKGFHLELCAHMLKTTRVSIAHVMNTMEARQPRVTGKEEMLKGNNLDQPYHVFSLVTHGFGHPNSLTFYKIYLAIVDYAVSLCGQTKHKTVLPVRNAVYQGHQNSQQPLQQIDINMQQPYFVHP